MVLSWSSIPYAGSNQFDDYVTERATGIRQNCCQQSTTNSIGTAFNQLGGDFAYTFTDSTATKISALVEYPSISQPVSGADVKIRIYDPENNIYGFQVK